MNTPRFGFRDLGSGVAFIVAIGLIVRVCLGLFTQEFEDAAVVTLKADRAGLLLERNAAVTYRGISVGRVKAIENRDGGAELTLALDPEGLRSVPGDVSAAIVPTTLLGSKFVELRPGGTARTARLEPGAVISTIHNTAELNHTFDHLMRVLAALKPAEVSNVVYSVSSALEGNGSQVNAILSDLETVLPELNDHSREFESTLRSTPPVLRGYSDLADPLVNTMANTASIAALVDAHRADFAALLTSLIAAGFDVAALLSHLEPVLAGALTNLGPVLELLARYSAEIPCLIRGHVKFGERARAVFGGEGGTHRATHVTLSMEGPQPPYVYPKNLPRVGAKDGPNCQGLPNVTAKRPYVPFDVGANPYPNGSPSAPGLELPLVGEWLFGTQLSPSGGR